MGDLTGREKMVLDYMKDYLSKWGYPPTVRDIASAIGIKSTSTVHKALSGLENKGYIKKQAGKRRAVDIVDAGSAKSELRELASEEVIEIPVVGRIAAGSPILAEENIEDSFPVPARFVGKETNFMLTVRGDSMIEAGIMDGDYILVRKQDSADNGDIVVALIDSHDESEATVKAFYKEKGRIRLQPRNSAMKPIIVDECRIIGLVKGVFRYFN